jgi:L-rhamnose isomerase
VTQMWWPTPESLKDLTVEETEEGFDLSAPDGSECGLWLAHFSETEELRQEFQTEFETCLLNYIREQDGKNEVPDRSESDCSG